MKKILFILLSVSPGLSAFSQAGSLDPSFGNNGIVRTDFESPVNISSYICQQILLHQDGSFYLILSSGEQSIIAHRLANTSLDQSYGENGYSVPVPIGNPHAVLQPDGKIVIGGYSMFNDNFDFALARFNPDGFPDTTFSEDGKQSTNFLMNHDYINAIALQSDGKIVVAGYTTIDNTTNFALARYNPDGSPDLSFSGDGKQVADLGGFHNRANALVSQTDGKIVAAGFAGSQFAAARFNIDGSLDNSFAISGKALISVGVSGTSNAVLIQEDNKIILGGYSINSVGQQDFTIVRLNSYGTLDARFSEDGRQTTDFNLGDDICRSLALQKDGKIIAAGSTQFGNVSDFAVARYNDDGTPDFNFSADGKLTTSVSSTIDFATSLAVQPDNKILVAGWSYFEDGTSYTVIRYNPDGNLDFNFNGDGILTDYPSYGNTVYNTSAIQVDGKIITAGYTKNRDNLDFAIARYTSNGMLDNSFSGDGKLVISFGPGSGLAQAVGIQQDGKILVGGYASNGRNNDFALIRLNPDGTLDNSFSEDGLLLTDFSDEDDQALDLVIQPDGKIVLAGYATSSGNRDFALARYTIDGTPDLTFEGDGKIVTDFNSPVDMAFALLLQPDGKIVPVGVSDYFNQSEIALARYNPDGTPDPTFDGDGKQITDIGGVRNSAFAAALQTDGRIVVTGDIFTSHGNDFLLARYNENGSLDNSFSGDGIVIMDMGSTNETPQAIAIQEDGKIVTGGLFNGGSSIDFILARFNANGTIDNGFSGDGKVITDFGFGSDVVNSISMDNNRIYAVGYTLYLGLSGAIAAYLINDIAKPCPADVEVVTEPGLCSATVQNIDPFIKDLSAVRYELSGATSLSGNGSASGQAFTSGTTTVTYYLLNNPEKICSFTVQVNDTVAPQIKYPVQIELCFNESNQYTIPVVEVKDNCGVHNISFSISGATQRTGVGNNASGYFLTGINTIEWMTTDLSGNASFHISTISVAKPIMITIPDAVALNAGVDVNTVYTGYDPASQLTLNAMIDGGNPPYTYYWSNGATTPSIVVKPEVSTTYTLTVTDASGCSRTATKLVTVVDVRCGNKLDKVMICQLPPGNHTKQQVICIDASSVQAHLRKGSYLGTCKNVNVTAKELLPSERSELRIEVYPNPTSSSFTLMVKSLEHTFTELKIVDNSGRLVERMRVLPGQFISLGSSYRPGVYFVEVVQNGKKTNAKLVKQVH